MTKLQNSENVANNVAQHLTEQYRKGELPSGWYYIKLYQVAGSVLAEYEQGYLYTWERLSQDDVEEVLAEVPSYNEWQQIHTEWQILTNKSSQEEDLKELLKEVQSKIRYSSPRGIETFADLDDTLLSKINQVLENE